LHPGRRAAGGQRIINGAWRRRHRSPKLIGRRALGLLHSRIGAAHAATNSGTTPTTERVVLADQPGKLRQGVGIATPHRTTPAWIETI
jgi:hypothetical protein